MKYLISNRDYHDNRAIRVNGDNSADIDVTVRGLSQSKNRVACYLHSPRACASENPYRVVYMNNDIGVLARMSPLSRLMAKRRSF